MAKGKRPAQQPSSWSRWAAVLGGLVVVALVVWWVASRSGPESAADPAADPTAPQPLAPGVAGAPTVEAAATLENVPPDSMASAGPDAPSGIDISNDPRLGPADARVTIVEFSDFQCPHCKTFHEQIFPALRSLYGDNVRWVFVNYASMGHAHAEKAAIGGECAARQGKFWEYADHVFANQEDLGGGVVDGAASAIGLDAAAYAQCVDGRETASEVAADKAEAARLGVDGTPYFFVNGHIVLGAQPIGVFNQVLEPYFNP